MEELLLEKLGELIFMRANRMKCAAEAEEAVRYLDQQGVLPQSEPAE